MMLIQSRYIPITDGNTYDQAILQVILVEYISLAPSDASKDAAALALLGYV